MKKILLATLCGLAVHGLSFNTLAEDVDNRPGVEQSLMNWSQIGDTSTVHASIEFASLLNVEDATEFVQDFGLSPFAVHMSLGDQAGIHRVDPELANPQIIENGLNQTREMKSKSRGASKARAKALRSEIRQVRKSIRKAESNGHGKNKKLEPATKLHAQLRLLEQQSKALLVRFTSENKAKAKLNSNPEIVFGLEFIASADEIRELTASSNGNVEVGFFLEDRIIVPAPKVTLNQDQDTGDDLTTSEIESLLGEIE